MNTLEALIFDVDGTLADTERDGHRVAFNRTFEAAGLDWTWSVELYGELLAVTGGKERMKYFCDHYDPVLPDTDDLEKTIAEMHVAKNGHYFELMADGSIPLRMGVERLLDEAREARLRLAIATTTSPENVEGLLTTTLGKESLGWFEIIAAGDCVPAKKPEPDIFELAMETMKLTPEVCMGFEDSLNGLKSSLAANLNTLITVNDYTHDSDFSGASIVLDSLGDPDQPFSVLSGDALGASFIDVRALQRFHQAWQSCE